MFFSSFDPVATDSMTENASANDSATEKVSANNGCQIKSVQV